MAKNINELPIPNQSRNESYLGVIAGQPGAIKPKKPQSRAEEYLEFLAENGIAGGGSGEGLTPGQAANLNKIPNLEKEIAENKTEI